MGEQKTVHYLPLLGISCARVCCASCKAVLELPPKSIEAVMAKHEYKCVACGKPFGSSQDNPVVSLANALVQLQTLMQQVSVELPMKSD